MIAGLFLLIIVGAIGVGVAAIARKSGTRTSATAPGAARRLVVFALLFALVVIAAVGIAGLVGRLLETGTELAGSDVAGLARSLAFTLIGGPLAALLWWYLWKGIDEEERTATAWPLYLAAMATTALITAATSLLITVTELVDGDWRPRSLAIGLVWLGVWVWHRWMSTHRAKGPIHLTDLAVVAGWVYGLVLMVGGAVSALSSLFEAAFDRLSESISVGEPWWQFTLKAAIWAVAGSLIWWWHWIHDDGRRLSTGLSDTALVGAGIVATAILALSGAGLVVFTLLSLGLDPNITRTEATEPLPYAIAALAVGGLAWVYHRGIALHRSGATRDGARLTMSGIGLVTAASGIGVIVNSILDSFTPDLARIDTGRALLLGGLSALIVGGPTWWMAWQPTKPAATHSTGRRIYLVAVFGVSAVVALITLLVIGYRVFEFLLDDLAQASLVDRIRAPFGLLVATGLVAGYHYPVWKKERESALASMPEGKVDHVILVTGSNPEPLRTVIDEATGAAVTVWMRTDINGDGPSPEHLSQALEGVTGKRIMVVTGPGARVEVIPLEG
jgi:hypothetical protein